MYSMPHDLAKFQLCNTINVAILHSEAFGEVAAEEKKGSAFFSLRINF